MNQQPCAVCGLPFRPKHRRNRICPNPDCKIEWNRRQVRKRTCSKTGKLPAERSPKHAPVEYVPPIGFDAAARRVQQPRRLSAIERELLRADVRLLSASAIARREALRRELRGDIALPQPIDNLVES